MKPDVGNCEDSVPRYYYDVETNSCKIFLYGGCRGNANNFLSLENCLARCQKIPIPDDNIPRAISDSPGKIFTRCLYIILYVQCLLHW